MVICTVAVLWYAVSMRVFFKYAWSAFRTERTILMITMVTTTGLGLALILVSVPMRREAHAVYKELYTNCHFGPHTQRLYEIATVLHGLRNSVACAHKDSVEECLGYEIAQPYTGFLKDLESHYHCSGFCWDGGTAAAASIAAAQIAGVPVSGLNLTYASEDNAADTEALKNETSDKDDKRPFQARPFELKTVPPGEYRVTPPPQSSLRPEDARETLPPHAALRPEDARETLPPHAVLRPEDSREIKVSFPAQQAPQPHPLQLQATLPGRYEVGSSQPITHPSSSLPLKMSFPAADRSKPVAFGQSQGPHLVGSMSSTGISLPSLPTLPAIGAQPPVKVPVPQVRTMATIPTTMLAEKPLPPLGAIRPVPEAMVAGHVQTHADPPRFKTLAGAIHNLAAAKAKQQGPQPDRGGFMLLAVDGQVTSGSMRRSGHLHTFPRRNHTAQPGKEGEPPSTLFSKHNYRASCDGVSAGVLKFQALHTANLMYYHGVILLVITVVAGFLRVIGLCTYPQKGQILGVHAVTTRSIVV